MWPPDGDDGNVGDDDNDDDDDDDDGRLGSRTGSQIVLAYLEGNSDAKTFCTVAASFPKPKLFRMACVL